MSYQYKQKPPHSKIEMGFQCTLRVRAESDGKSGK